MFKTLQNALKIPDLRKKLVFTFLMLVVFRIGTAIPVPGINVDVIKQMISQQAGILSFYDIIDEEANNKLKNIKQSIKTKNK